MAPTDPITSRGGKFYVTVNGNERSFYSRDLANRFIGHEGMKAAKANEHLWRHNADLVNRQLGINTQGSASNSYYLQGAAKESYAKGYENFWQTALNEQDARIRASVTPEDFTSEFRTIDGKPVNPDGTPKNKPVEPDGAPKDKPVNPDGTPKDKPVNPDGKPKNKPVKPDATKKGFKIPKGLKKFGKIGGIALAAGLAIAGIASLLKGCGSEKEQPVEEVTTPPVDDTKNETSEETKPQEPVVQNLPNGMQLVDGVYTVKKGDCVWNIAKAYLIGTSEDPNYVPTDAEILAKTKEIMALSKEQESIDLGLKTLDFDNTRDPKNYYVLIQPEQKILIESQKTENPEEEVQAAA